MMKFIRLVYRFYVSDHGVASIYMLCLLPLFLMILGFGIDGVAAFRTQGMLQSTADASALAAALKLPVSGTATATQTNNAVTAAFTYATANMSVAGFGNVLNTSAATNGDIAFGNWNGTTFATPAPNGTAQNAVRVTVRAAAANGNAYPTSLFALSGKASWDIGASAVAVNGKPVPICVLTFSSSNFNGAPGTDLKGCTIASNADMDCHGHNLNAGYGIAVGTDNGCGITQFSNQQPVADPYKFLSSPAGTSSIPANTCPSPGLAASYPQEAGGKNPTWNGPQSLGSTQIVCGDLQLKSNVTVTTPAGGSVLVIENGQLDLGSHTLSTANGSALTVILTGPTINGFNPTHSITGNSNSTLDIAAPSSGTWNEMAVYQDYNLTKGVDIAEGGQGANGGPNWNVTGIMYFPNASVQIKGLVSPSSSNPSACFILVANTLLISGTGQILAEGGCTTPPTTLLPISLLVQ